MIFYGTVKDGELKLKDKRNYNDYIGALEGKRMELDVKEFRGLRSVAQNNLYWGVYIDSIVQHTGDRKDAIHSYLKEKFLSRTEVLKSGVTVKVVGSTAKLNTKQFSQYLDQVHHWALDEFPGFVLPTEEEYLKSIDLPLT